MASDLAARPANPGSAGFGFFGWLQTAAALATRLAAGLQGRSGWLALIRRDHAAGWSRPRGNRWLKRRETEPHGSGSQAPDKH